MKKILSLIISGALVISGYSQTRNVLVGTNNAVVQPTNFWSADASNARTGLGLGTAATNPASAFQPASSALTNLASSNAVDLTNLQATNLIGVIPSSNIPSITLTNIIGTLAIVSGGTGATNDGQARANLGATTVGDALFIATNAASARTIIGALATNGDAINLTNFPALLLRTNGNASGLTNFPSSLLTTNGSGAGLTNLTAANITGTVALASNVTGTIAISNGGSGATTAGGARTNLGLGWSALTNSNAATSLLGLNTNGHVVSGSGAITFTNSVFSLNFANDVILDVLAEDNGFSVARRLQTNQTVFLLNLGFTNDTVTMFVPIAFNEDQDASTTRTNLGIGWSALTNSNAGTGLVSVNTNGDVVSPTNFWQRAPIQTLVQDFTGIVTGQTNNATNARNVYVYSLATNVSGISNTIILPTNALTFNGDEVTVVHKGTTNTITVIRQAGSTNNLITLNKFDESVKFIRELGQWDFYHNISFVEPIQFSGTNAAADAAASRTNVGLGETNSVVFKKITLGDQSITNNGFYDLISFNESLSGGGYVAAISAQGNSTNSGLRWIGFRIESNSDPHWLIGNNQLALGQLNSYMPVLFRSPFDFNHSTNAAISRTNLGLGATWLTNTNSATFRSQIGVPSSFGSSMNSAVGIIGGGSGNLATEDGAYVAGGYENNNDSWLSFIGSGFRNAILKTPPGTGGAVRGYNVIGGGLFNTASNNASTVGGGAENSATGDFSTISGGSGNLASGRASWAGGYNAKATNNGAFVWSDDQGSNTFSSTNTNSFNVRASGGARFVVGNGGISSDGDITISNSTESNGLLFIRRTNNEAFLGMANLIASNNTTVSNETMLRVGLAEATNRSAQFGFRVARTNNGGEGFATFSVFGYNALMMIGPSDRSRTNTATNAGIEADIYSIGPTNKVMTLITTNTGATLFHRAIEFENTTNQAVTRTNLGLGATNNVTFSNVTASGTLTATSTVTAKTNLIVEGHLDFTTNATNSNPATNNQIQDFIEIRIGTNQFWLPVYK